MIYEVLLIFLIRSCWEYDPCDTDDLCAWKAAPVSIPVCPFLSPLIEYLIMGMRSLSNWTWLWLLLSLMRILPCLTCLSLCLDKKKKEELRSLRMTHQAISNCPLSNPAGRSLSQDNIWRQSQPLPTQWREGSRTSPLSGWITKGLPPFSALKAVRLSTIFRAGFRRMSPSSPQIASFSAFLKHLPFVLTLAFQVWALGR